MKHVSSRRFRTIVAIAMIVLVSRIGVFQSVSAFTSSLRRPGRNLRDGHHWRQVLEQSHFYPEISGRVAFGGNHVAVLNHDGSVLVAFEVASVNYPRQAWSQHDLLLIIADEVTGETQWAELFQYADTVVVGADLLQGSVRHLPRGKPHGRVGMSLLGLPSIQSPTYCAVCGEWVEVPGHWDQGCIAVCAFLCGGLSGYACVTACSAGCWVPGYRYCAYWEYYSPPCPE